MNGRLTPASNHPGQGCVKQAKAGSLPCLPMENTMLKKAMIALVAGTLAFSAAACNTVKGVGKDIQSVGEAGDRAIH